MIVVWTALATVVYFAVGFFLVPLAIVFLRPLIKLLNLMLSAPAAKTSDLTAESHMAVGLVFFTLMTVLALLWGIAFLTVTSFAIYPWPVWIMAALLSFMNWSNATSRPLNVFKSDHARMEADMAVVVDAYNVAMAEAATDEDRTAIENRFREIFANVAKGALPTWRWR